MLQSERKIPFAEGIYEPITDKWNRRNYEARNDILGNVKEYGLQPLLQMGKYLAEVCATVGELAEVNAECRECPYFKYCAGGCRAVALTLTGDKMGVDLSKCLFFKKGYYEKVVQTMGEWGNNTPIRKG